MTMIHKCKYAEAVGLRPEWQTDDKGLTVCTYCHEPKEKPTPKAASARTTKEA